jgi:hypothetical protein
VSVEDGGLPPGSPIFEKASNAPVRGLVKKLNLMDKVAGLGVKVDAVDVDPAGLRFLIRGERGGFGDDVDFDAALHEPRAQVVHVGADAADDAGRVFPREHDDAEHKPRLV